MITVLTEAALAVALVELSAWTYDAERQALHRELILKDFSEAFGLMTRIALEAEKTNHHPEWCNVYNRLRIWLTTHDANGISDRDLVMARTIDRLVG